MFDLKNIKFIKGDEEHGRRNYSFVGIQRSNNNDDEQLEFWLPLGFKDFDHTDYECVKDFFFKMYKTFKVYLKKKKETLSEEEMTTTRDGIIEKEEGFNFDNERKEQPVLYGKLNAIDKILEGYDELRISALEKKQVKSHNVDFTKLHRYMHQAVFLDDDVIYLDEMNIAKNVIVKSTPRILQLFCFIFTEIKNELNELDFVPDRAIELSEQFKEENLQPGSTLFHKDQFAETLDLLKEIHEEIDLRTTYKDEDYWHFYEAVEAFLYGERDESNTDIYWGFSSFYDIWEDMCVTYVINNNELKERIAYADVNGSFQGFGLYTDMLNPFQIKLNNFSTYRKVKPDLVLEPKEQKPENIFSAKPITKYGKAAYSIIFYEFDHLKELYPKIFSAYWKYVKEEENFLRKGSKFFFMYSEEFTKFMNVVNEELEEAIFEKPYKIVDYKYMRISDFQNYSPYYIDENGENKVKEDIHKQLVYEWTVQQNWSAKTQSEFWIPFYSSDEQLFEEEQQVTNMYFNESQIKLVKINFHKVQKFYLQQTEV